ncbi:hypothetical protein IW492_02810 [Enterococcus sp. BWB1-3]|uniref:hypothetical protein n=1 Tax=Enterococcus sp. BWB1-3 TaxID=2787713 RepID=UPI0019246E13|nr:hypothetical protein [Enterococcus sp. BWB1-3]MBL1228162.1 hypothetical protein [Enterococcus sp. BWB1-3]
MKYKCVIPFFVDRYESEERDDEPTEQMEIEKDSIWERRDNPSDYDVMLDNVEDGDWLGIPAERFKDCFELCGQED